MVFYRKYRPQKIEELDSKEVREKLYNVLESSSVPHAFLFTGSKGLGKTSTARIVAKVLNCEKKTKGIEPCNKCEQCVSITNGTNMDILEIDGASNRGIDEIRDLREKVKLSPMSATRKVYIIDEVHMLTTEAFNALLKTLEEPPSHVVFILCTTEPHKVPGTIISRCLRIQFKRATEEELVRSFGKIIKKENLEAEEDALRLIANLSDGSFRDGAKILEEIVTLAKNKKITKELVEKNYSIASTQYQIAQMIKSLEEKDTKGGLGIVAKLASEGVEMGYFMQGLIETLHNSLLFKAGVEFSEDNSVLVMDNSKLEIGEIKRLIELLAKAKSELKYAVLPQLPLELVIVEWCSVAVGADHTSSVRGPVAPSSRPTSSVASPLRSLDGTPSSRATPRLDIKKETINIVQQGISNYSEHDALWTALVDKVKTYNHSIAGVLRGCSIKSYDGKKLLLQTNFKFHKDKLSEVKTEEVLENALRGITKKNVKIEIELKNR
ncbi:MAG: DNA polymerase III, subunit gamma and tau [Candidatus Levybacteria bacterium RIFCSPLOWO2_01_FULL_39_24]|nr:MAG: DNA polymerase III, subunit gamma and tau [Candidatus Levybacteria bacterium RIFCSPHIGHO2_01_FULL_40_16]OGH28209.1 MAG: DNA polymerase III, subunit gamma and tau [Candidatus Levybacteria bacterium RIFCSPHIGHO2_12_FULL_39_9]OGH46644.1 MAG: DNA polymerase III, subunit gamma and tau [Candidatus Levybacteria bacterium RIFCSPLOWO2_01_FULL_39_24]